MDANTPTILESGKTLAASATTTIMFGLTATEVGLIFSFITLIVTIYVAYRNGQYTKRKERREIEMHELRMKAMSQKLNEDDLR